MANETLVRGIELPPETILTTTTLAASVAATGLSIGAASGLLAFNATAPIAKPAITGAKAGNTAVAGVIAGLVALGLVTDSTT
jgi:hypothetical protein